MYLLDDVSWDNWILRGFWFILSIIGRIIFPHYRARGFRQSFYTSRIVALPFGSRFTRGFRVKGALLWRVYRRNPASLPLDEIPRSSTRTPRGWDETDRIFAELSTEWKPERGRVEWWWKCRAAVWNLWARKIKNRPSARTEVARFASISLRLRHGYGISHSARRNGHPKVRNPSQLAWYRPFSFDWLINGPQRCAFLAGWTRNKILSQVFRIKIIFSSSPVPPRKYIDFEFKDFDKFWKMHLQRGPLYYLPRVLVYYTYDIY